MLAAVSKRLRMSAEAATLAVAAGLLYGVQDALTRVSGERYTHGGLATLVVSWQPYAVLALGVTGLVLVQSAFETAPLRMSLPALTAAQPLAGIVCGVGFLGDRLRTSPGGAGLAGGGAGGDRGGHRADRAASGDAVGNVGGAGAGSAAALM
ncbi:hypothetical protein GCM10020221_29890 [Streptomyces thioluteus]|uniref:EamA domain-containing protein n=1 Tax=Streptomyces thioluteus TaxID=66431 RepID=A0ABN3WYK6_STRTU